MSSERSNRTKIERNLIIHVTFSLVLMVLIYLAETRALQRKLGVVYSSPVMLSVSKSILIILRVRSYFDSAIQKKDHST